MNQLNYRLELGTREIIDIFEIELDGNELDGNVFQLCSHVPRSILEEAKGGWTKPLERMLRTPPVGALLRLNLTCASIDGCPIGKFPNCSTSFLDRKERHGAFPDCWMHARGWESTVIVHAWRNGLYVIIADPTS